MSTSVVKMSAPTADQIAKAMENLHSRVMEMEKSKPDPNTRVTTPMNQEAVNAFFAPQKNEPTVKGETSQSAYPTSSCSAGTPSPHQRW